MCRQTWCGTNDVPGQPWNIEARGITISRYSDDQLPLRQHRPTPRLRSLNYTLELLGPQSPNR
jgi:hypothetical protein